MTRLVMCRKYQEELPGLDRPPYPGAKGQDIYDHVSRKAWEEWQKHQTMLINERRLNMMNAEDRKFLQHRNGQVPQRRGLRAGGRLRPAQRVSSGII